MNKEIFEKLTKEAASPYNYGKVVGVKAFAELNPSCGDAIMVYLKIDDGIIKSMFFESQGCILSKATASLLARYVEDKSVHSLINLDNETILADILPIKLGLNRARCGLLAIQALKKGLKNVG